MKQENKINLSSQQIYDKICLHLAAQKRLSKRNTFNGLESCAYRGAGGSSCAIGCLIPDEMYTTKMEGLDVYGLVEYGLLSFPGDVRPLFLRDLQIAHDMSMDSSHLKRKLQNISKTYSLEAGAEQAIIEWNIN